VRVIRKCYIKKIYIIVSGCGIEVKLKNGSCNTQVDHYIYTMNNIEGRFVFFNLTQKHPHSIYIRVITLRNI
jgi:phosphopentomutase